MLFWFKTAAVLPESRRADDFDCSCGSLCTVFPKYSFNVLGTVLSASEHRSSVTLSNSLNAEVSGLTGEGRWGCSSLPCLTEPQQTGPVCAWRRPAF